MTDLERRVFSLERGARHWRWFSFLLVLILAAFVLMGQTKPAPTDIEAQHIRFRDSAGHVRMELKQSGEGVDEEFGVFISDAQGKELCSLQSEDHGQDCFLAFKVPAEFRQRWALQIFSALSHDAKFANSMTPEDKALWEKKELARIAGLGDATLSLGAQSLAFIESSGRGSISNTYGIKGLNTTSIVVDSEGAMKPDSRENVPGRITVVDGRVEIRSSKSQQSAMLGSIDLEDARTGNTTALPVSSLTLFDKDGKVLFQAPR